MLTISVAKLSKIVNPLQNPPWDSKNYQNYELNINLINTIIKDWDLLSYKYTEYNPLNKESHLAHIQRIVYFIKNWTDEPITLTFYKNIYPIYDGCHRFAAAIYLNKEFIFAQVEGDKKLIKQIEY